MVIDTATMTASIDEDRKAAILEELHQILEETQENEMSTPISNQEIIFRMQGT